MLGKRADEQAESCWTCANHRLLQLGYYFSNICASKKKRDMVISKKRKNINIDKKMSMSPSMKNRDIKDRLNYTGSAHSSSIVVMKD